MIPYKQFLWQIFFKIAKIILIITNFGVDVGSPAYIRGAKEWDDICKTGMTVQPVLYNDANFIIPYH